MIEPHDIPWQSTAPSCAQIAAHAQAHPLPVTGRGLHDRAAGLWLVCPTREDMIPRIVALAVQEGPGAEPRAQIWIPHATSAWMGLYSWLHAFRDAGWLPCSKDGIPVAMLDMAEQIEVHENNALERGERD